MHRTRITLLVAALAALVAAPAECLTDRAFRRTHPVALGGVEAVDAEVERAIDGAAELRLLDLPDELLDLLESGELSEGHGKALLAARGNDVRRRLGREAARHGWSVRETENRAKLASQPNGGTATKRLDPEEQAALRDAADRLESALGHEVRVRPRKGEEVAVEIRFEDLDEALALARRLGARRRA